MCVRKHPRILSALLGLLIAFFATSAVQAQLPTVYPGNSNFPASVGIDLGGNPQTFSWSVSTKGTTTWAPILAASSSFPNGWYVQITSGNDPRDYPTIQVTIPFNAVGGTYTVYITDPSYSNVHGFYKGSGNFESNSFQVVAGPSGLTATAANGEVALSWPATTGAKNYLVYRGTTSGGETLLANSPGTSYTDGSVTNGTTYYYYIKAVDQWGTSLRSNEASATPSASLGPPPAPTNLTAKSGNTQVALSWTGSSAASSFNVYRGTSSGQEGNTPVATGVTSTSYTNTGLTNGTTYFYEVTSVSGSGESARSNEASATPEAPGPNAAELPPGGAIMIHSSSQSISMPQMPSGAGYEWEILSNGTVIDSSSDPIAWDVADGGPYSENYGSPPTSELDYIIAPEGESLTNNLQAGTATEYSINNQPYEQENFSVYYDVVSSLLYPPVASTPTLSNLGYSPTTGFYSVQVNWPSAGPTNIYLLHRLPSTMSPTHLNLLDDPALGVIGNQIVDSQALPGATYIYYVNAVYNSVGGYTVNGVPVNKAYYWVESDFSPVATITLPPAAPILNAKPGNNQVFLNWSEVSATSYNVYRGTASGQEGDTPYATGITNYYLAQSVLYTDGGVSNGTTYYYEVTAVGSGGEGPRSNEVAVTPDPIDQATGTPVCVPTLMATNQGYTLTLTMQNTGNTTWNADYSLEFGQKDNITWNISSISLPAPDQQNGVAPGDFVTFQVPITAPSTTGNYVFDAVMSNGTTTFPYDLSVNVSVVTPAVLTDQHGANPYSGLMQGADGMLYGTTVDGGTYSNGTAYVYNPACGCVKTLHSFNGSDGLHPYGWLVQDSQGKLYGTTNDNNFSGADAGTIFDLNTDGSDFTVLYDIANVDLEDPNAGLTIDPNGNFYGTCIYGGFYNDSGGVFEFNVRNNAVTSICAVSFNPWSSPPSEGGRSYAGVTVADGGIFTVAFTPNQNDTNEEVTRVGVLGSPPAGLTLQPIAPGGDGSVNARPEGTLIPDSEGYLYGTDEGSSGHYGDVYKVAGSGLGGATPLHTFNGTSDGSSPVAGLTLGSDGYLYGVAPSGGVVNGNQVNDGTIFKLSTAGTNFQVLHTFSGSDGANPDGTLLLYSDGYLYGTCYAGGQYGAGDIFKIEPNGSNFSVVYSFQ